MKQKLYPTMQMCCRRFKIGNKTQAAIQDIQKRTGIAVDGVVGKQTNAALDTLSMQKQVTVKSPISISSQNKTPQNNINSTDTYKQYLEKKEEWLYNGNKDKPSVVDKGNSTNKQNVDKQGTTGTGNSKEGDKVFIRMVIKFIVRCSEKFNTKNRMIIKIVQTLVRVCSHTPHFRTY